MRLYANRTSNCQVGDVDNEEIATFTLKKSNYPYITGIYANTGASYASGAINGYYAKTTQANDVYTIQVILTATTIASKKFSTMILVPCELDIDKM